MAKKNTTHSIDEKLIEEFDEYCEKNHHNKSAVVEHQIKVWLKEKKAGIINV